LFPQLNIFDGSSIARRFQCLKSLELTKLDEHYFKLYCSLNNKTKKLNNMKTTVLLCFLICVITLNHVYSQDILYDKLKICTEIKEFSESGEKAAGIKGEKWSAGQTLRVKFIDGDAFVQAKVRQFATVWADNCNIRFTFVNSGPADIRIRFITGKGSWSLIGKASLKYSVDPITGNVSLSNTGATMNFGWFNSNTTDDEFSRTVIHEFGHAIGLIHEHQSPVAGISWNPPLVYNYYSITQGWTKAEVDQNIFIKYSKSQTQYSSYDKLSIMHYAIPADLLFDPTQAVGWNTVLSAMDKSFISAFYPFPKKEAKKEEKKNDGNHTGDVHGGVH